MQSFISSKRKTIAMLISLGLIMIFIAATTITANPERVQDGRDYSKPTINFRHEYAGTYDGNPIYRLIASVMAPGGLRRLGFVISYNNEVILPVNSQTLADIEPPQNTTVRMVTTTPFSLLAGDFNLPLDTWLMRDGRTGFSFDFFATDESMTPYTTTDVFAFYYRMAGNDLSAFDDETFRLEDGRMADSMISGYSQVSFVRPGIEILSGSAAYIWGHHVAYHGNAEIPDANIIWTPPVIINTPPEELSEVPPYAHMPRVDIAPTMEEINEEAYDEPEVATPTPTPTPVPVETLAQESATGPETFVVVFGPEGGTLPTNETGLRTGPPGFVIDAAPSPTRAGYSFIGWYFNNYRVTFPLTVSSDMALMARWQAGNISPTPSPAPVTSPTPTPSPSPAASPSPSPSPAPGGNVPNPTTSPINISFAIFGAVLAVGLASYSIIRTAGKQKAAEVLYNSEMTRFKREKRITDMLDE